MGMQEPHSKFFLFLKLGYGLDAFRKMLGNVKGNTCSLARQMNMLRHREVK